MAILIEEHDKSALHALNAKSQRDHVLADVIDGKFRVQGPAGVEQDLQKIILPFQLPDTAGKIDRLALACDLSRQGRTYLAGVAAHNLVQRGGPFAAPHLDATFLAVLQPQLVASHARNVTAA